MFDRLRRVGSDSTDQQRLKRLLEDCHRLLGEAGESISQSLAERSLAGYQGLSAERQLAFFQALASDFNPDGQRVREAAARYADSGRAADLVALVSVAEPPRQELFRRLNRVPHGCAVLVALREKLLTHLKRHPELQAVDADLHHLLSSWFNPGFLRLEQLSWDSPAGLLEQIIAHEAVHEIDGWADLRCRLQPDRRLFAYFHPALPREPLIFVEVAFSSEMPSAIGPLLERKRPILEDMRAFKVATFYSISNCQPGLKGVHLGNFLIKRVAELLQRDIPSLKIFCTLSPVPSLMGWLSSQDAVLNMDWSAKQRERYEERRLLVKAAVVEAQSSTARLMSIAEDAVWSEHLESLCSAYLSSTAMAEERQTDPVARFHLNNGARLERVNPRANLSPKGLRQSLGLMVNYLYDLEEVETNHERFVRGEATSSRPVLKKALR